MTGREQAKKHKQGPSRQDQHCHPHHGGGLHVVGVGAATSVFAQTDLQRLGAKRRNGTGYQVVEHTKRHGLCGTCRT